MRFAIVRAFGMASRVSRVIISSLRVLWRSTVGDSPETVIVSCTVLTFKSAFTVATNVPVNSRRSRWTVAKPARANVTE